LHFLKKTTRQQLTGKSKNLREKNPFWGWVSKC
jgi:hypothetical protein